MADPIKPLTPATHPKDEPTPATMARRARKSASEEKPTLESRVQKTKENADQAKKLLAHLASLKIAGRQLGALLEGQSRDKLAAQIAGVETTVKEAADELLMEE